MEKMAWDCPKWGREDFFLLIQTLPTFWAERIWTLRTFIFLNLLDPKFLDFQVPRFPKSGPWPGLGQAMPGLSHLVQQILICYQKILVFELATPCFV